MDGDIGDELEPKYRRVRLRPLLSSLNPLCIEPRPRKGFSPFRIHGLRLRELLVRRKKRAFTYIDH